MKKKIIIPAIFFLLMMGGVGTIALAQETAVKNVGFPSHNIWFSKESFIEGEEILIHALVLNDTPGTFSGDMEFYDSTTLLGKVSFSITTSQKVKVISFKWKALSGDHRIYAKITNAKLTDANGKVTLLALSSSKTNETPIFVEQDVNKNGIADSKEPTATSTPPASDAAVFDRGIDMVKGVIPESVKTTTGGTFSHIENFRRQERDLVEIARIDNIDELDALNTREISVNDKKASGKSGTRGTTTMATGTPQTFTWHDQAERPLRYVYWLFLAVAGAILNRGWLFYIVLIIALYFVLHFIWRKVRGRQ